MNKIDLHLHTNYSDGSDSLCELLIQAEKAQLEVISITDHDNCLAYGELKQEKVRKLFSGKIIKGVELEAAFDGIIVELLGFGVDTDKINANAEDIKKKKKHAYYTQMLRLYEICKRLGVKMADDVLNTYVDGEFYYPASHIHREITKHKENRKFIPDDESWNNGVYFGVKHITDATSPFYVDMGGLFPTLRNIYDTIREAGGLVFIAHIFNYGDKAHGILDHLTTNFKIDGIECYYSKFTTEQTKYLLELCKAKGYLVSGGSDYHGECKPDIKVGTGKGDLMIPMENIRWITDKMLI